MAKKSTTTYHKFKGQTSYAMVYKPDEFRGASNWKLNLHVTDEVAEDIADVGIQLRPKKSRNEIEGVDHQLHFTFKRPTERSFGNDVTYFAPPVILGKDGEKLVYYVNDDGDPITQSDNQEEIHRKGDPILFANGSVVEIEVEVYQTKTMGKGNRLRTIRLIDVIEYVPAEDVEDEEVEQEPEPEEKPKRRSSKKVDW